MPLKLNLGLMKKIGQPRYSSLSASCHLEIELESSLLERDAEGLQDRIRRTVAACRRAVDTELAIGDVRRPANLPAELDAPVEPAPGAAALGLAEKRAAADRNGTHRPAEREPHGAPYLAGDPTRTDEPAARPASASQLSYVRRLASRIGRAAALRVEVLARRRFGKPRSVRVFVRPKSFHAAGLAFVSFGLPRAGRSGEGRRDRPLETRIGGRQSLSAIGDRAAGGRDRTTAGRERRAAEHERSAGNRKVALRAANAELTAVSEELQNQSSLTCAYSHRSETSKDVHLPDAPADGRRRNVPWTAQRVRGRFAKGSY